MSEQPKTHERQRNREIPFPETLVRGIGKLEDYLLGLDKQDTLDYENLPPVIASAGIERYANWLSGLTQADSLHRERAAYIHLRLSNNELIFPSNPKIGDEYSSEGAEYTRNHSKFFPLVRIHSHPNVLAFSYQDLKRVIDSRGILYERNDFVADMVATTGKNYLLLRTGQTGFLADGSTEQMLEGASRILRKTREQNLELVQKIARKYKIAFYASNRDGEYKLLE